MSAAVSLERFSTRVLKPSRLFRNAVNPGEPINWGPRQAYPFLHKTFYTDADGYTKRIGLHKLPALQREFGFEGTIRERTIHICNNYPSVYRVRDEEVTPSVLDYRDVVFSERTLFSPLSICASACMRHLRNSEPSIWFSVMVLKSSSDRRFFRLNDLGELVVATTREERGGILSGEDERLYNRAFSAILAREPDWLTPDVTIQAALDLVSDEHIEAVRNRRRESRREGYLS